MTTISSKKMLARSPAPVKAAIEQWHASHQRGQHLTRTPALRQQSLAQVRAIAAAWGGVCLSDDYLGIERHLTFRCRLGHVWQRTPATLLFGYFCPVCSGRRAKVLRQWQAWAKARGWACLSTEFVDSRTPLHWRCDQGHEWFSSLQAIRAAKNCPACYRQNYYHTLATMQALARDRGGECLSTSYKNVNHKLSWRCHRGHEWNAPPCRVMLGTWCPQCARLDRITKPGSPARRKYITE